MYVCLHAVQEADENERKAREKQARVEASMKEREKEVKESLENSLRERDKERDQHKKDEAMQSFKALLVDLVDECCLFVHLMLCKDRRFDSFILRYKMPRFACVSIYYIITVDGLLLTIQRVLWKYVLLIVHLPHVGQSVNQSNIFRVVQVI